ncbi:TIGR00153 family protein [Thermotoga sp. KOL6]|uniref:TIGR00153 family protein n=1 Tax=Thermotoga sp. KOL6 TaxID=126741 RepID=UPI000C76DAAD|nr:TIGR00153 family protein [Thermotoga sp. KOL6]PLV58392.1 hypothetical protein AS005_08495 [Thermotoga sp. KOL6]
MWFSGKKESDIISLFFNHVGKVEETLSCVFDLLKNYLRESDEIESLYIRAQRLESEADRARRKTEMEMYSGAFLPNFRGDLLGLIESLDKVANKAEYVADLLVLQKPEIPSEIKDLILRQMEYSLKAFSSLKLALKHLFEDLDRVGEYVLEVERYEHEEDSVEREALKKLFNMEIDRCKKLEVKELIRCIGDIADRTEDVSDRVEIVLLKRRF